MARQLVLSLLVLTSCVRRTEYAYAHTITGVVIDQAGRPVAGAQVNRVDGAGATMGSIYETTTDAAGRFEFRYRGLAGERQAGTDVWQLVANGPNGTIRQTVRARWSCTGDGGSDQCPGFKADVVLQLHGQ